MTLSYDTINFAISVAGLVVCILGLIMAITGSAPEKRTKRYFLAFFSLLIAYVAANLLSQIEGGMPNGFAYKSSPSATTNVPLGHTSAIVDGDVPDGFTLKRLRHGIPDDWDEQRREFGFL